MAIRLEVLEPDHRAGTRVENFPCDVGVVFPPGTYSTAQFEQGFYRVEDDLGNGVEAEASVTAFWDEARSSVKWLLVHIQASTDRDYWLDIDTPAVPLTGPNLATSEGRSIRISNHGMAVDIPLDGSALMSHVVVEGKSMLRAAVVPLTMSGLAVVDSTYRSTENPGLSGPSASVDLHYSGDVTLAHTSQLRAIVTGQGHMTDDGGVAWCSVDWRLEFYRGERFCRLLHTITWMRDEWEYGSNQMSISIPFDPSRIHSIEVDGMDESSPPSPDTFIAQVAVDALSTNVVGRWNGSDWARPDDRLRGAADLKGPPSERRIGVCVRDFWQHYPKGFSIDSRSPGSNNRGRRVRRNLNIDLWPRASQPMSFRPEDLMPESHFASIRAGIERWSTPLDDGSRRFHGAQTQNAFRHTGEGVARTQEILLAFGSAQPGRSTPELRDLLDFPVVLRQDPEAAMAAPFLGFQVPPRSESHGWIEDRLVDIANQMFHRTTEAHDYGHWRFGTLHWNWPTSSTGAYRTFDGTQYGLQLIPWLLFMRGGPRWLFDEATRSTRFAMDVGVNHYTTRGGPPGFAADARSLMLPWQVYGGTHYDKKPKLQHLLACYHLTGYERARETAELQISGAYEQLDRLPGVERPLAERVARWATAAEGHGDPRERLNPILFWAQAASEIGARGTWSNEFESDIRPALGDVASDWWAGTLDDTVQITDDTIRTNRDINYLLPRPGQVYAFDGFALQHQLGIDQAVQRTAAAVAQTSMDEAAFSRSDGRVYNLDYAVGAWWRHQQGDAGLSNVLWDLAQGIADCIATGDRDYGATPVRHLQYLKGDVTLRQHVWPIIAGLSAASSEQLDLGSGLVLRDTLTSLGDIGDRSNRQGVAYLRSNAPGALEVEIVVRHTSGWNGTRSAIMVAVDRSEGGAWVEQGQSVTLPGHSSIESPLVSDSPSYDRSHSSAIIEVQSRQLGDDFRIRLTELDDVEGADARHLRFGVMCSGASVVNQIPVGNPARLGVANLDTQLSRPGRLYVLATAERVVIRHTNRKAFSVRAAGTWDLLHSTRVGDDSTAVLQLGVDRSVLAIVAPGDDCVFVLDGVAPYASATRDGFFLPPDSQQARRTP